MNTRNTPVSRPVHPCCSGNCHQGRQPCQCRPAAEMACAAPEPEPRSIWAALWAWLTAPRLEL